MGLFKKKEPTPAPVRKDVVLELLNLQMREDDANPDGADFVRAHRDFNRRAGQVKATQAEYRALGEALKRNGY